MHYTRAPNPLAICFLSFGLASCAALGPKPTEPAHAPSGQTLPPLDLFRRELALARRARAEHLPSPDKAGARQAYYAIMVPACERVERLGPDKYRAGCKILNGKATSLAPPSAGYPACDDRDDSQQSAAEITACVD
jgi:hypothetical protein